MKREDLTGQIFGQLTALRPALSVKKETKWVCKCSCGTEIEIYTKPLKRGVTKTCGCTREHHGASDTVEYATFRRLKQRCSNPNDLDFPLYGGRGIHCNFETFAAFLAELGPRPSRRHSVDRIDTNGHYEPGNVRWATAAEQANNMRCNRLITFGGKTLTLSQWGASTGLGRQVLEKRLDLLGWPLDRALTRAKR